MPHQQYRATLAFGSITKRLGNVAKTCLASAAVWKSYFCNHGHRGYAATEIVTAAYNSTSQLPKSEWVRESVTANGRKKAEIELQLILSVWTHEDCCQ